MFIAPCRAYYKQFQPAAYDTYLTWTVAAKILLLILWPFALVTALLFFTDLVTNNWRFSLRALLLLTSFAAASLARSRLALAY